MPEMESEQCDGAKQRNLTAKLIFRAANQSYMGIGSRLGQSARANVANCHGKGKSPSLGAFQWRGQSCAPPDRLPSR